jgi:hypothetical protein
MGQYKVNDIDISTLRMILKISPRKGIGIGPGIPIRRKTLFRNQLYLKWETILTEIKSSNHTEDNTNT